MAHYKRDIVDVDLETCSISRSFLNRTIGYKDDDADRFGIRAFRNGVPQDLSGASCQAIFMAPDGTKIALTSYGTVSGNLAYVTLPPACYDVEGQFTLAIKIVGGGVTSTVRIVDGVVSQTGASGTVSPTSAVPTYQEVIAQFDAMVAATSAANTAIAETFDATQTYPAGKYVINDGALYILPEGHEANVTWANTTKKARKIGNELYDTKNVIRLGWNNNSYNVVGWQQGSIDTSTGSTINSTIRCRTGFVQFPGSAISGEVTITPKSGYKFSMGEYSAESASSYVRFIQTMSSEAKTITINSAYYYKIVVGKTNDSDLDPADVASDALIVSYKSYTDTTLANANVPADAKATGDAVNFVLAMFGTSVFDWSQYATSENPTGWQVGSWNDSGQHQPGAGNAICLNVRLDKTAFEKTTGIKVEYSGGYTFSMRTYKTDTPNVIKETFRCISGDIILIDATADLLYGFTIAGFGTDAQTKLDNGYVNSIKITRMLYGGGTVRYKRRETEFERFNIVNDRSWGAIGVTTSGNVEPQNPVTTKCVLSLPTSYTQDGKPTPLIMFGHGAGGYITDDVWYSTSWNFITMIQAFTAAGFAVFDVDNTMGQEGGFADWGCLPLMTSYIKAWEYIKDNYNVEHDLFIVSDSMGTCASLNMLKWYGNRIRTAIQIAPRPFSKYRYATQTDEKKKEMLVAYGIEPASILNDPSFVIPDDSVFDDKYKGFFQYDNIVEVNGTKVIPNFMIPPIKVIVGAADTQFLDEVRIFYQALRNSGNYVDYREVAGATHNISFLPNYPGLTPEAVNWLKRFKN